MDHSYHSLGLEFKHLMIWDALKCQMPEPFSIMITCQQQQQQKKNFSGWQKQKHKYDDQEQIKFDDSAYFCVEESETIVNKKL